MFLAFGRVPPIWMPRVDEDVADVTDFFPASGGSPTRDTTPDRWDDPGDDCDDDNIPSILPDAGSCFSMERMVGDLDSIDAASACAAE